MDEALDLGLHSRERIAEAMERNMVGHMSWAAERLPGATVLRDRGLTLVDSGFVTDTFNVVCGSVLEVETADAAIAEAIAYFRVRELPFSWWVGPASRPTDLGARLLAHGLVHAEDEAGMVLDLEFVDNEVPPIEGVEIVQVSSAAQLLDLAKAVAANWSPPDQEVVAFYEKATPVLLLAESPFRFWVAYADDQPVAACESFLGAGVAGVYAVVTREAYRRRGIGSAVTRAALQQARSEGYRVATLQASGQGQRIYERIGFVPCGMFSEYKPAKSS